MLLSANDLVYTEFLAHLSRFMLESQKEELKLVFWNKKAAAD